MRDWWNVARVVPAVMLMVLTTWAAEDHDIEMCIKAVAETHLKGDMALLIHWGVSQQGKITLHRLGDNEKAHVLHLAVQGILGSNMTVQIRNEHSSTHNYLHKWPYLPHSDKTFAGNTVVVMAGMALTHRAILTDQIAKLKSNNLWRSQTRLLLVLYDLVLMHPLSAARILLRKLWEMTRAANAVVMIVPEGNSSIEFYKWTAYTKTDCTTVREVYLLDTWQNGVFVKKKKFYEAIGNLNGCVLYAGCKPNPPYTLSPPEGSNYYQEGLDIRVINTLSEFFNFTIAYLDPPSGLSHWVIESATGQPAGYVAMLNDHTLDLLYFGIRINDVRAKYSDPLDSFMEDTLVWVVPTPAKIPYWKCLADSFAMNMWIALGVTFLCVTFTIFLIANQQTDELFVYRRIVSSFFVSVGINVNYAVAQPRSALLRNFILLCYIQALITTSAYTSVLISLLRNDRYDKSYEFPIEAAEDGLVTHLFPAGQNTYNQSDHELWNIILQPGHYILDEDYLSTMQKIAFNKTEMILMMENPAKYEIKGRFTDDKGKPYILILKEKFMYFRVTFYLSKGHPMVQPFRKKVNQLVESGIINKWLEDLFTLSKTSVIQSTGDGSTALTTDHFQGPILLLLFFSTVSCFVFAGEVLVHYMHQRRNKTEKKA